jgi:hypothetical protein
MAIEVFVKRNTLKLINNISRVKMDETNVLDQMKTIGTNQVH